MDAPREIWIKRNMPEFDNNHNVNGIVHGTVGQNTLVTTASNTNKSDEGSSVQYLTREDLEYIALAEPVWRQLRIGLLVSFCVLWIGLLIGTIVAVVFTEKCPPKPALQFWQSKVAYYIDPFAFKDSTNNWIGDLPGLIDEIAYVKDTSGAGFVILTSIFQGHFTNNKSSLGHVDDFEKIDPALGTMEDFRKMLKVFHRQGMEVVLSLDFNGISENHIWMADKNLLKRYDVDRRWVSRNGLRPILQKDNESYYSVDNKLYDLDLLNPDVWEKISGVVHFWLNEGVDGILLKSCAFYVESDEPLNETIDIQTPNKWFSQYPSAQLFSRKSVTIVQRVRELVDNYSASGKQRVVIVDVGDIGYGLEDTEDKSVMFLGTDSVPGAHLVFHRHFVKNRGWKFTGDFVNLSHWSNATIHMYNVTSGSAKTRLALPTATDVDLRHADVIQTAAIFLLPGTPVLYYGSEIGIDQIVVADPPGTVYPINKVPNIAQPPAESVLSCQLPMPWDRLGSRFTAANDLTDRFPSYLKKYRINETIESVTAVGRGTTLFMVIQKLIQIRNSPSFLWGELDIPQLNTLVAPPRLELFVRKAVGFPAFIVVLDNPQLDAEDRRAGSVIYLSSVCRNAIVRFVHPEKPLKEGMQVEMTNVYITMNDEPSIHIFECVEN